MIKLNIQLFAASGTITFPTAKGDASWKTLTGRIVWSETNVNVENNTSDIKVTLGAKTGTGGTSGRTWKGSVKIGNQTVISFTDLGSSWADKQVASSYVDFKSYTLTGVQHNDDGKLSISISGSITGPNGTSLASVTSSGNQTVTLTEIARASKPTTNVSTANLGTAITINTNRASTNFYHTIVAACAGQSDILALLPTIEDSVQWTPDISKYANAMPNTTSSQAVITCTTYNGYGVSGTQIGTPQTCNMTLTIPSSVVPTATLGTFSDAGGIVPSSWGIYVKGKSKLRFNVSGTGIYSSTITGYKTTVNGETKTTSGTITTTNYLTSSSTATLTVTDSRGRTGTASRAYTVVDYSNPNVTTINAQRCNSAGVVSDSGTYLKYTIKGTYSSCNSKNSATYYIGYKLAGSSGDYTWVNVGTSDKTDQVLSGVTFNTGNSYTIGYKIVDALNSTSSVLSRTLNTEFKLINYKSDGHGLAIGKKSETTNLIESNLELKVNSNITAKRTDAEAVLKADYNGQKNIYMFANNSTVGVYSQSVGSSAFYNSGTSWIFNGNASTATNSTQLNGMGSSRVSGAFIPKVSSGGGVMEIGKYIDFHNTDAGTSDYDARLYCNGTTGASVAMPTSSGTLALTSQIPTIESSINPTTDGNRSYFRVGNLLVCWGKVAITPVANNPTKVTVTFPKAFASVPSVISNPATTVPYTTVRTSSVANVTTTTVDLYIVRTNTTTTSVYWIAIGQTS